MMPILLYRDEPYENFSGEELNEPADEWKLCDIFDNEHYRGKVSVEYRDDFGDSWDHNVTFPG